VGPAGEQGVQGETGATGDTGATGAKGDKGDAGEQGPQGLNGFSAYQVAQIEGFTGTEAEWLASLIGPQGAQGEPGADGLDGIDGTNGLDGADGAQGPQGETGPAGPGVASGGLEGQILAKSSDLDYATEWIDNYAPDTRIIIKNDSGVAISRGDALMAAGATGDRIRVAKAVANGSVEPRYMLGLAHEDIANGAEGFLTMTGEVSHVNTSAYSIGTVLYIDPDTAGALTTTEPSSPELVMPIAIVTRAHAVTGRLFVRMWSQQSGLHELHDVLTDATPADNEVLAYDSASGLWKNSKMAYTHNQEASSNQWIINHNLKFYPNVTITTTTGVVIDADVKYNSSSQVELSFSEPISGFAYLS
jgi:hypothetical protein